MKHRLDTSANAPVNRWSGGLTDGVLVDEICAGTTLHWVCVRSVSTVTSVIVVTRRLGISLLVPTNNYDLENVK